MNWFIRFFAWAALLELPCWAASDAYGAILAAAVNRAESLFGLRTQLERVNVAAPYDLGIFIALCLATRSANVRLRLRALLIGLPVLMLVEVILVTSSVALILRTQDGAGPSDTAFRAGFYLTDAIPWLGAVLTWLVLLGRYELPTDIGPPVARTGSVTSSAPHAGSPRQPRRAGVTPQ